MSEAHITLYPPTLTLCVRVHRILKQGRGQGERVEPERKLERQQFAKLKLGRKYQLGLTVSPVFKL